MSTDPKNCYEMLYPALCSFLQTFQVYKLLPTVSYLFTDHVQFLQALQAFVFVPTSTRYIQHTYSKNQNVYFKIRWCYYCNLYYFYSFMFNTLICILLICIHSNKISKVFSFCYSLPNPNIMAKKFGLLIVSFIECVRLRFMIAFKTWKALRLSFNCKPPFKT